MTASNFDAAFARLIVSEGGYVDNPKDPGGATNLGVTIGTLSAWLGRPATKAEVKALTRAKVAPIYRRNYWDAVRGDDLPAGVDYTVFDYAVNSGPGRAIMSLQRAAGVADDGKPGPLTLAAIGKDDPSVLIRLISAERLAFMRRLSTWPVFGRGWTARVTSVEAAARRMANLPASKAAKAA